MPVGAYKPEIPKWSASVSDFPMATTAPNARSTWWGPNGKPVEMLKYIPPKQAKNR